MAIKLKSGNGPVLRAPQRSDLKRTIRHDWITVQTEGGVTTQVIQQDAEFNVYTGATYHREGVIEGINGLEIENLDPTVGTVDSDGVVTRLTEGVLRLRVKTDLVTIPLELDLRDKTEASDQPRTLAATVSDSLARHLQQQVDSRLAAIAGTPTMGVNGLFYTTQNHSTQTYVRNPDVWCADVDRTCISPWNSEGGVRQAGTLIAPRQVLTVYHAGYYYNLGARVRFVSQDGNNTVYERTVVGRKRVALTDLVVHTLDADLPTNVRPCKVMPSDWRNYLVHNVYNRPPVLSLDQEEKALIKDFKGTGWFLYPVDAVRLIFSEEVISGDSGNPSFFIFNNELVLITLWTGGFAGSGNLVADHIPDLNQAIVDSDTQAGVSTVDDPTWPNAGGHYQVKEADFSAFPNYS